MGTSWGQGSVSKTITLGGRSKSASGFVSFASSDTNYDITSVNHCAGSSITDRTLYAVNATEIALIGNSVGTCACNSGIAYRGVNGTSTEYSYTWSNYKIDSYYHKYIPGSTLCNDCVLDDVSGIAGEPVFYYSGLPICKATAKGKLTIKIRFTHSQTTNNKSTFQIKKRKFTNTNIVSGVTTLTNATCDNLNPAGGDLVTVTCDVEKDDYLWIKVCPDYDNVSYLTTVKTETITLDKD